MKKNSGAWSTQKRMFQIRDAWCTLILPIAVFLHLMIWYIIWWLYLDSFLLFVLHCLYSSILEKEVYVLPRHVNRIPSHLYACLCICDVKLVCVRLCLKVMLNWFALWRLLISVTSMDVTSMAHDSFIPVYTHDF